MGILKFKHDALSSRKPFCLLQDNNERAYCATTSLCAQNINIIIKKPL